jgi:TRAP-type C4-dicarboxylate transport system substrate-binding protein
VRFSFSNNAKKNKKVFKEGTVMKRYYIFFSVAIISLLVLSLISSCATTTTTPATSAPPTTQATTSAPAPASSTAAIKLVYATNDPEAGLMGDAFKWWASEVNKRTNGQVTIQFFWNSSLAKMPEMLEAVQKGTADMGNILAAYFPQVFPLHGTLEGLTVFHDKPLARIIMNETLDQSVPEAEAEWGKAGLVKIFATCPNANYYIYTVPPITKLSDFKGLKIRATGSLNPTIVKALEGTTVGLTGTDEYDALVKGTIDGTVEDLDSVVRFRAIELVKSVTLTGVGANNGMTACMKADVWKQLPPDVQKVITDLRAEYPKHYVEMFKNYFNTVSIPNVKKFGTQTYTPTAEEMQALRNDPGVLALQNGWVDKVAGLSPSLTKARIEEIGKLYVEKLEETGKLYPDTLSP